MPREYFLLLSSFLIGPAVIAPSHALAAEAPQVIVADEASPLTIAEAKANAYAAVSKIRFQGMHFRTDIADKAIKSGLR